MSKLSTALKIAGGITAVLLGGVAVVEGVTSVMNKKATVAIPQQPDPEPEVIEPDEVFED